MKESEFQTSTVASVLLHSVMVGLLYRPPVQLTYIDVSGRSVHSSNNPSLISRIHFFNMHLGIRAHSVSVSEA